MTNNMSRLAQLPPRFPLRNSLPSGLAANLIIQRSDELSELTTQHDKLPSQGSFFQEQPLWIDDLLADCGTTTKISPLRRAVSDPVTIMEESSDFDFSVFPIDEEVPFLSEGPCEAPVSNDDASGARGTGCLYGPNSPRKMKSLSHSESDTVSAIFESVNPNPFQYVSVNTSGCSDSSESGVNGEISVASDNHDYDKLSKRHTGQRSRVRKLQYIAELESTVNVYQTLEADLAAKVAYLYQQRALLYLENSTLKQNMTTLRKEKAIKDGQYQSLKNEFKKLKAESTGQNKFRNSLWASSNAIGKDPLPLRIPDMGRLSLGENQLPLRHGFKG